MPLFLQLGDFFRLPVDPGEILAQDHFFLIEVPLLAHPGEIPLAFGVFEPVGLDPMLQFGDFGLQRLALLQRRLGSEPALLELVDTPAHLVQFALAGFVLPPRIGPGDGEIIILQRLQNPIVIHLDEPGEDGLDLAGKPLSVDFQIPLAEKQGGAKDFLLGHAEDPLQLGEVFAALGGTTLWRRFPFEPINGVIKIVVLGEGHLIGEDIPGDAHGASGAFEHQMGFAAPLPPPRLEAVFTARAEENGRDRLHHCRFAGLVGAKHQVHAAPELEGAFAKAAEVLEIDGTKNHSVPLPKARKRTRTSRKASSTSGRSAAGTSSSN